MADKPKPPAILGPDGRPVASRAYKSGIYRGGRGGGGIHNQNSGLGGASDKAQATYFKPTRFYWRTPLEIIRNESWAARKAINIPVDDMFLRWRTWEDGEAEGAADAMVDAEQRHNVTGNLADAMKAGGTYGTGVVVMVTREAPLDQPLMVERIRPGDLAGLLVFDRFDLTVAAEGQDILMPAEYQRPLMYRIQPRRSPSFLVHASRVLRFDGIAPLTSGGFDAYYGEDWGLSELIPILTSIFEDQTLASAVAHLSQEASIPVLAIRGLAEKAAGAAIDPDEQTLDELGERINDTKSNWNLLLTDKESEEFTRVPVVFQGLANLMDKFPGRIAMACDIPRTRFEGNPPTGMNATGESDMRNYVMMVEAKRVVRLAQPLPRLDAVLARDAGFKEPPEYTWSSLIELSEKEIAEAAKVLVEALDIALKAFTITEDEFRRQIDGHPVFGALPEMDLESLKPDLEPPDDDFGGGGDDEGDPPDDGDDE